MEPLDADGRLLIEAELRAGELVPALLAKSIRTFQSFRIVKLGVGGQSPFLTIIA